MKKVFIVSLVLVLLLGTLFAGGSSEVGKAEASGSGLKPVTIEYWSSYGANENQGIILQEAANDFMKANPGVKINMTFNGRDNRNLAPAAIKAGTDVDMMDAVADNINVRFGDYILDISSYMTKDYPSTNGKSLESQLMPSMISLSKYLFDGKVMFVPFIPQAYMITCNKNIFDKCGIKSYPTTWQEFLTTCEIIKSHGYIPISSDSFYCNSWLGYYLTRLMGNEAMMELANNPKAWSDPRVLEGASAIEYMAKKGYFDPDIASLIYPNAQQNMVINENIAMYINGSWLPNEVKASTSDTYRWGFFAYPQVPGGVNGQEGLCYSTFGMCINKNCSQDEIDAAMAFAAFVTCDRYDQDFVDRANSIPVNVNSTWPSNLAELKNVFEACSIRYPSQTAFFLNNASKQVITDACLRLMSGEIDAATFVKEASNF